MRRAIWGNNTKLAELLIQRSEFADAHLYVHDNRVHVVDAVALECEIADIKHKFLSDRCESLSARAKHPRTKASTPNEASFQDLCCSKACEAVASCSKTHDNPRDPIAKWSSCLRGT